MDIRNQIFSLRSAAADQNPHAQACLRDIRAAFKLDPDYDKSDEQQKLRDVLDDNRPPHLW